MTIHILQPNITANGGMHVQSKGVIINSSGGGQRFRWKQIMDPLMAVKEMEIQHP